MSVKLGSSFVDFLDEHKRYIGSRRVYNLKCSMYQRLINDQDRNTYEQTESKGIHSWKLFMDDRRIVAWADEITKWFGKKVETVSNKVTCAYTYFEHIKYIKLIPANYNYTMSTNVVGTNFIDTKAMRIEIGTLRTSGSSEFLEKMHIFAEDTDDYNDFSDELMAHCDLPADVLHGFNWNGDSCRTIEFK